MVGVKIVSEIFKMSAPTTTLSPRTHTHTHKHTHTHRLTSPRIASQRLAAPHIASHRLAPPRTATTLCTPLKSLCPAPTSLRVSSYLPPHDAHLRAHARPAHAQTHAAPRHILLLPFAAPPPPTVPFPDILRRSFAGSLGGDCCPL